METFNGLTLTGSRPTNPNNGDYYLNGDDSSGVRDPLEESRITNINRQLRYREIVDINKLVDTLPTFEPMRWVTTATELKDSRTYTLEKRVTELELEVAELKKLFLKNHVLNGGKWEE